MTLHLGNVDAGITLYIPWHTFDSNGASITLTGLAVTDVEIYKNGSVTQRSSDAGYALLDTDGIDFDGITGIHGISIDLNDNTDAGFYSAGAFYWVVISAITVDTRTLNFILATFRIGPAAANATQWNGTAVATPATAGIPDVNVKNIDNDAASASGTVTFPNATLASTTNITAGTITTATNVTTVNGLAAGVITAASIAADAITDAKVASDVTIASVTGAVGSVTGNVGGNVVGSVASVTAGVTLAAAAVQAIWDALTSALTTAGSIGKLLVDNINATISSRLAAAGYTAPDNTTIGTINTNIGTPANLGGGATLSQNLSDIEAQTDDIGVAGAGLTALGDARIANLDAAISTRATPTNITAGVITTVTNLTNAPTAGDLTATMKASVNAEVLDVLNVDTFAQPGQEAPAATTTLIKMLTYLYKGWRNKKDQTATARKLYADNGTTVDQLATDSDDGSTYVKGELGSGP